MIAGEQPEKPVPAKAAAKPARPKPAKSAPAKSAPAKSAPATSAADKPATDPRYARAWSILAGIVTGAEVPADAAQFDPERAAEVRRTAHSRRAHALLAESLAGGASLEHSVYRTVAALAERAEWNEAWALVEGLARVPGAERAADVGLAVLHHRRRQFTRAWTVLASYADRDLAEFAPVEAIDGALSTGAEPDRHRAFDIAAHVDLFDPRVLIDLAGRFLAFLEWHRSAELVAELERRPVEELDERTTRSWQLVKHWLQRTPKTVPAGAVPIAVIDYQTPDQVLASGNVGDYVQTLAMLGNLVRFPDATFSGEAGLGEVATELQQKVRTELQLPGVHGNIHLLDVNREFSNGDEIPEQTWMIAFGWHMHPMYDLRYDFPYHPNIRPLFVSFHINRLDMLTPEALEYLRRYGPVGCRDWTTVDLLLSAGVEAFFSGCLTTTVDTLFPLRAEAYSGKGVVGVIDLPRSAAGRGAKRVRTFTHQADQYRHMTIGEGVRAAWSLLADYQQQLQRAVTRRLHAYLPLTSLGVPVEFQPGSPGDVRFPGLSGLTPDSAQLADIQHGIRDLLGEVLTTVLSDADEQAVYARWRELTADRVEAAKQRLAAPAPSLRSGIDVSGAVGTSWDESARFGPAEGESLVDPIDVVLCYDQNLMHQAAVLLESALENASRPLRVWILGRGLSSGHQQWLAAAFPSTPITFLPCDHVDYGDIARIPARITVSTMDRLLLPHLLRDVNRVVYLDIDTVVLGDLAELIDVDLGDSPVAARDSFVTETSEWRSAARRLPEDLAVELQRRMSLAHPSAHAAAALNAGVLVLDLARMRSDEFTEIYLGWVERYGLHDQDIMLAYSGPERRALDPRWNAMPVFEDVTDPALIHWASLTKPWEDELTHRKQDWRRFAERLAARTPELPAN